MVFYFVLIGISSFLCVSAFISSYILLFLVANSFASLEDIKQMVSEIVSASFQSFCFQGDTFFFFCCSISSSECCSVISNSLQHRGLYSPWNSPGKNTGMSCHALLQGIFPTQGSKPGHLHCKWILYCLSHQRSPKTLEWVAYPFSRGSSQPRNQTRVSCIAGGFFTS